MSEITPRLDNRAADSIRDIFITPNFVEYATGSVLIELGKTKVLCAVSVAPGVPVFLKNKKTGWITAEYAMLPVSTHTRIARESVNLKRQGRSVEISRLIGRVFRSVVNLENLGEHTLVIDCDVLQADGGTRTAAIIGTNCALLLAQKRLLDVGVLNTPFLSSEIMGVSVGMVNQRLVLDLDYEEDSKAAVDFNFILTKTGQLIEVQGTAEQAPVDWQTFAKLHELAQMGRQQIFDKLNNIFTI